MDPQQRLLMTYVWKAIEDAGYSAASLAGSKTAILVGIGSSGYGKLIAQSQTASRRFWPDRRGALGRSEPDELFSRLAWPERADRNRLLELAGGCASGSSGVGKRQLRDGDRRRSKHATVAQTAMSLQQGRHAERRRPLQDVLRDMPTAMCAAKASACWC